jgi:hypothetical protein
VGRRTNCFGQLDTGGFFNRDFGFDHGPTWHLGLLILASVRAGFHLPTREQRI